MKPSRSNSRRVTQGAALAILSGAVLLGSGAAAALDGDPERGVRAFRACGACHSLSPGVHRTGPSLAGVLGRTAGTIDGFRRYSPALKGSGVVWDRSALDAWIKDPAAFIPGNRMTFPGLKDDQARADLIAYLEQAAATGGTAQGDSGGMMGGGELPDLKTAGPENRVTAIRYCADTYEVTTEDGTREPFWEFNLRFKTDGSDRGPEPGKPVIVGAGMMGDRASVVFAVPKEISAFIREECR